MNIKHIGFTKGRRISNIFYVIAGFFLVYRILMLENGDPMALAFLGLGILFFCIGMSIYNKYCRCPKCGRLQPRFVRYSCSHCKAELD